MTRAWKSNKALSGKRILVCGKGGSVKSTLVAMMATILQRKAYQVMVLDGDASNPEGLVRLLFGLGVEGEPKPSMFTRRSGLNSIFKTVTSPYFKLERLIHTDRVATDRWRKWSGISCLKEML